MRVLFLYGDIPYPPNTGARLRTYNLLKNLAQRGSKITLVTMMNSDDFQQRLHHMTDLRIEVVNIDKETLPQRSLINHVIHNFFTDIPLIVGKYQFDSYNNKVKELCQSGEYDLLHCDSIALAPVIKDVTNIPRVLTEHNIEALIWERYAQQEKNIFKKIYIRYQYKKILNFEIDIARICEHVITVSEEDKQRLNNISGVEKITVVPNGVDTAFFSNSSDAEEKYNIVFTGSMDWRPNQDAIDYFMEDIWPILKKKQTKTHLWLVGRKPTSRILSYGKNDENIHVTGEVDDVRPFVEKASVFIVPLRIGGGSRLKILEAWSMNKAVVSTAVGAEGLSAVHAQNILIADKPEQFAGAVDRLIEDEQYRKQLASGGRDTAINEYDWSKVAVSNENVWKDLLGK